ncbi:MAG: endonuclease [Bacteroidota bacterium]
MIRFSLCTFLFCLTLWSTMLSAQVSQTKLFPDLSGNQLLQALVEDYKPSRVLINAENRDTLFARVYAVNDSLSCVYTGYTIYLDPRLDPTQAAFMDGESNGINTEHTWPQAFGAGNEPAKTDMHHLFPTRVDVNGRRSNFPFADIPDETTQSWFFDSRRSSRPPSTNRDAWSEYAQGSFEPREDHKGNVARAIFYFYTMYRDRADGAGPGYFEQQRETLCRWHYQDPVDEAEFDRTWRIARHQSGRPNPFVLDCSLPERCYCTDQTETCEVRTSTKQLPTSDIDFAISPNPSSDGQLTVSLTLSQAAQLQLSLWNCNGQQLTSLQSGAFANGAHQWHWNAMDQYPTGMYFIRLDIDSPQGRQTHTRKVVFLP